MKKTLTILLLAMLTLALLLCGCNDSKKKDEIIKKVDIRIDNDSAIVVYEDGYERTYSLTQPIETFVENNGTRSARAIGVSLYYFTSTDNPSAMVGSVALGSGIGDTISVNDSGDYVISGSGFVGNASMTDIKVQMSNSGGYLLHDGKKYENCDSELLTVFRNTTTFIDFATGYEKEPFDNISGFGFEKFQKLESVLLPTSIKSVGKKAFEGCEKLTTVYYLGTEAEWQQVDLVSTEIKHKDDKDEKNEITETVPNLLASCTVYFYSESAPTNIGNYWHFVDGKPVAW